MPNKCKIVQKDGQDKIVQKDVKDIKANRFFFKCLYQEQYKFLSTGHFSGEIAQKLLFQEEFNNGTPDRQKKRETESEMSLEIVSVIWT